MSHSPKSAGGGAASGSAAFDESALAAAGSAVPLFSPYANASAQALRDVYVPGRLLALLAERTKDLAGGVSTVAQLLEDNELRKADADKQPLLSEFHAGALLRMSVVVLDMLADDADELLQSARRGMVKQ